MMDYLDHHPAKAEVQQVLDRFEQHYTPEQWVQAMVMVVVIQSFQLDMNHIVTFRTDTGTRTNSPSSSPFLDDEDMEAIVKRLPLSPLNVCGWKGLQCSIDQSQVKSLIWSKFL
jgi:hypothetical protein